MAKKRRLNWAEWEAQVREHQNVFDPFQEWVTWHFADMDQHHHEKTGVAGYIVRPNIGLRLLTPDQAQTLAVRPGWRKGRRDGDVRIRGVLQLDRVELELLTKGRLTMRIILVEGQPAEPRRVVLDPELRRHGLRSLVAVCHGFLMDPQVVMARSSDNCVNCGKGLSDDVSRTRGIGPECIRRFNRLLDYQNRPRAVDLYRDRYVFEYEREFGLLPGLV
jgi:hypothetical protein